MQILNNITALTTFNAITTLTAFIFGLFIGSLLNVVIYRLPLSIVNPTINLINPKRSFCPVCEHKLGILETMPVLSYLYQKGKCQHCHITIS